MLNFSNLSFNFIKFRHLKIQKHIPVTLQQDHKFHHILIPQGFLSILSNSNFLRPLAPNPPSQLYILWHNSDPLGMNSTQIRILKQSNQISLRRLLKCGHGGALEAKISLEILRNLPHKPLEWKLPYQQFSALLVLPDFPQRHRARAEPVRLFDTSGCRRWFPCRLCRQLLPRSLPTSGFPGRLLCTCHWLWDMMQLLKINLIICLRMIWGIDCFWDIYMDLDENWEKREDLKIWGKTMRISLGLRSSFSIFNQWEASTTHFLGWRFTPLIWIALCIHLILEGYLKVEPQLLNRSN